MTAYTDTFTRADADALGNSWTETLNDLDIVSNTARNGGLSNSYRRARWDIGNTATDNLAIEGVVRTNDIANVSICSILARYSASADDFYEFRCDFLNQQVRIFKVIAAGTPVAVGGGVSFAFAANTDYRIRATINVDKLEMYVDGVLQITRTDTSITTGKRGGIRCTKDITGACWFDEFTIADYVAAALAAPLGALTATIGATVKVPAGFAAPLGALTAAITATPKHPATLAAPLGGVTAALGATVTHPVPGVLAAPLGGLVASVAATPKHPATLAAPLGGLTAALGATVTHPVPGVLAAPLGALVAAVAAQVRHPATLSAPLGALVASISSAKVIHRGVLTAPLGGVVASISGFVAEAPIGLTTYAPGASSGFVLATEDGRLLLVELGLRSLLSTDDLLDGLAGLTSHAIRFELLNPDLGLVGEGETAAAGVIEWDGQARAIRTLSGLLLPPDHGLVAGFHRVRPIWVVPETGWERSLGIYEYDGGQEISVAGERWLQCNPMLDGLARLLWPLPNPVNVLSDDELRDAWLAVLDAVGVSEALAELDPSAAVAGDEGITFGGPNTAGLDALSQFAALQGWLPPHVTIDNQYRGRAVPVPAYEQPVHVISTDGEACRIVADSIAEVLPSTRPNLYIAYTEGAAATPISARLALPVVDYVRPRYVRVDGAATTAQAEAALATAAQRDAEGIRIVTIEMPADPRIGMFDIGQLDVDRLIVTAGRLPLDGSKMSVTLTSEFSDAA